MCGPAQAAPGVLAVAEAVGDGLARGGAVVICGGLGGAMEAVSRGAARAGGVVVGVLPGLSFEEENSWLSVALPTGLGQARNAVLVGAADAVVAIGGGWGTLSEIGLARRLGRPVVGLNTWAVVAPEGSAADGLLWAADAADAVAMALEAARGGRS